ncbi:MAG: hypothetical protein E6H09_02990 [Bacteroidetes bacterium]|jgi:hypothetical protein|nr:MAG: hypothetical protein E6H09_02990 [Bacteroidota bacterium]
MRKVLFLGTAMLLFSASFAISNVEVPVLKADQVFIPIGKTGQKISYAQLATISMTDLQALTGRKMSFIERMNFRMAQSKIRKSIATDGTIKNKKIAKFFTKKGGAGDSGFHLGGFALGFFVGLIGVLIAYLLNDDYKQNRIKWAWIGFGVFVVLWIILVVAVFSAAASTVP